MPGTIQRSQRRRRAARPLSVERILDTAVALIERDGPDALSMRRLGAELGVEGMALYHHLEGREDLLRRIGERLFEPLQEIELSDDWREACRRLARALRAVAVANPGTFRLVGMRPFAAPAALRPVERFLAVLVASGFTPADALAAYRAVASYARGYALAEATGFTVDAYTAAGRHRLRELAADEFPTLTGCLDELAVLDADIAFERGLRALVEGFGEPR